jgi:hypothetical protein
MVYLIPILNYIIYIVSNVKLDVNDELSQLRKEAGEKNFKVLRN